MAGKIGKGWIHGEIFGGVWYLIVKYTKLWFLLLPFKHMVDGLEDINNS